MKNITFPYGLVQCTYWMGGAVFGAFSSFYLLESGLSNSAIGVVLSASCLIAGFFQPLLGAFIDRNRRITNRLVITFLCALLIACCSTLFFLTGSSPYVIGFVFALSNLLLQLSFPFVNAMAMEYINGGYQINFGISRACGSCGYGSFAFIMGIITVQFGARSVPLVVILSYLVVVVLLIFFMPHLSGKVLDKMDEEKDAEIRSASIKQASEENTRDAGLGPIAFIKKYPRFMGTLFGWVFVYFSHSLVNIYALQILMSKGGNSGDVGTAAFIAAAVEMVPMIAFPFFMKKFRLASLLRISAIFFTLKIIASMLAPSVGFYLAAQTLQLGGWGIVAVALVYYVNEVVDHENASQGQAYAGVSNTLGSVTSTLICGRMLDLISIDQTLIVGIMVSVLGTVIIFITTRGE